MAHQTRENESAGEDSAYRRQLADWVMNVLAEFEPFTPAQRDRLAVLLAPTVADDNEDAEGAA